MRRYVLGFLFEAVDHSLVVMIRKRKGPDFNIGKWNGVGGKVEDSDISYSRAMQREFVEETGLIVPLECWNHVVRLTGPGYVVQVFSSFTSWDFMINCRSLEEEEVKIIDWKNLPSSQLAAHLSWIIPRCLDTYAGFTSSMVLR